MARYFELLIIFTVILAAQGFFPWNPYAYFEKGPIRPHYTKNDQNDNKKPNDCDEKQTVRNLLNTIYVIY